jgi:hypothetical protein
MRSSTAARDLYATTPSVREEAVAILELNANAGISYSYVGFYGYNSGSPSNSFSVVNGSVVGAKSVTRFVKRFSPINNGTTDSDIAQLRYVDEPDYKYAETFPIESILDVNRPGPGIVKMTADTYGYCIPSKYTRTYCADPNAEYKYWKSEPLSGSTLNGSPFVKYVRGFWTNKIKVTVETHRDIDGTPLTRPTDYEIQVLGGDVTTSGTWTTAYTGSNNWPSDGSLKIYYYNGRWTQTPAINDIHKISSDRIDNAVKISGVRVLIKGYPSGKPISFIEVSPRLSLDVSSSMLEWSGDLSMAEDDSALPVGSISANDMNVRLENYDGTLSFDRGGSIAYGYQPKKSTMDFYVATGPQRYIARISSGIIDEVSNLNDGTIEFSCLDKMSILQTTKLKGVLLKGYSVSQIVRAILDWCGISEMDFVYTLSTDDHVIPFFYVDEDTAYSALNDLAEAYQFAMYFDADGVFKLLSKEYIMDSTRAVDLFISDKDTSKGLANIKEMTSSEGKPINDVIINYKHHYLETGIVGSDRGDPSTGRQGKAYWWQRRENKKETVWEAPSDVLAAAGLVSTLSSGDTIMTIDQEAGSAFSFAGYAMIDSEVIAYDAKRFFYRPVGVANYVKIWVESDEQYQDLMTGMYPGTRMYFTGELRIPTGGRGRFGSKEATHYVDSHVHYPYTASGSWSSWKTCPYISLTSYKPNYPNGSAYGSATWRFKTGSAINLRSDAASSSVVRKGSNSAVRLIGPTTAEIEARDGSNSTTDAVAHAAHWYIDTINGNKIPRRVGAGVRLLGRSDLKEPYGLEGCAGVGMWMYSSYLNGGHRLNGWVVDVRATVETKGAANVKIYQVVNDKFVWKAEGKAQINVFPNTVNPSMREDDLNYHHIELSHYAGPDGKYWMYAYVDGRYICRAEITNFASIKQTAVYGPYVRARSYADFDYVWWSDQSNMTSVDGVTAESDTDWTKLTTRDALYSAAGPPIWWSVGTRAIYSGNAKQTETFGMEEFGPVVHEVNVIREGLDNAPIINPEVVASYGSEVKVPVWDADPFSVEMVVVNARRRRVILGESSRISVVGYPIKSSDRTYTLDDLAFSGSDFGEEARSRALASRRVHGDSPIEISTDLIQTTGAAESLLKWILKYQTLDCDVLSGEIFGHPGVEPGDIVSVNYNKIGHPNFTHKFVVVSVKHSWDNGLKTNLSIRRIS